MKPKPDFYKDYNEQLDSLASETMQSILIGIYGNPLTLKLLDDAAKDRNKSLADEIAERSYIMAAIMMRVRKDYLKIETNGNNKSNT